MESKIKYSVGEFVILEEEIYDHNYPYGEVKNLFEIIKFEYTEPNGSDIFVIKDENGFEIQIIESWFILLNRELSYDDITLNYLLSKYPKIKDELNELIRNKVDVIINSEKTELFWRIKIKEEERIKLLNQRKTRSKYVKTGSNKNWNVPPKCF